MSMNKINGISPESIQDFDDVRTWARDHEIRVTQLHDAIVELGDNDDELQKGITRSLKLLRTAVIVFGSAFSVVVILFGIILISRFF